MKLTKAIVLVSMLTFSGAAFAQGAAAPAQPAPPAPTAPAKPVKAMKKPRSAKSLECSKKADEQKLHGKARKHFMSKCKKS
jgi:psiF repeat